MDAWGPFVAQTLVATLLSGSIVGLSLKSFLDRRIERHRFTRDWMEQSLAAVVGPVVMHLERTSRVGKRYRNTTYKEKGTSYFDAMLMRDSNEAVRSILLSNGHLCPENLRSQAHDLVEHYDLWLRRFDAKLEKEQPTADSVFDIGFVDQGFPKHAVKAFQGSYERLREELYGVEATHA